MSKQDIIGIVLITLIFTLITIGIAYVYQVHGAKEAMYLTACLFLLGGKLAVQE